VGTEKKIYKWDELHNPKFNRKPEDRRGKIAKYGPYDVSLIGLPEGWIDEETGLPYLIDGAGRQFMAKAAGRGQDEVEVNMRTGMSREEAREVWYALNTYRAGLGTIDIFLSHYRSGDPLETQIMDILKKYGLTISKHGGPGVVSSPKVLLHAFQLGVLEDIISVSVNTYGELGEANNSDVLGALCLVFQLNEDRPIDNGRLAAQIRKMGIAKNFVARANTSRTDEYYFKPQRVAAAIVQAYNAGTNGTEISPLRYPKRSKIKAR
jgi:hypothetical protein